MIIAYGARSLGFPYLLSHINLQKKLIFSSRKIANSKELKMSLIPTKTHQNKKTVKKRNDLDLRSMKECIEAKYMDNSLVARFSLTVREISISNPVVPN